MCAVAVADPLAPFSPAVRAWFESTFEAPTQAQAEGWAAISAGHHTLIHAPTGSGKTLAAFLWTLDRLAATPRPAQVKGQPGTVRVLYVSPLKALTYDVERNLRAPLAGIGLAAARLGEPAPDITVASRTGDTPAEDRRNLARRPPDILITTPESLYLLLTSQARDILRGVEHVIIDEIHSIAGSKRGAHLALSLERLERLVAGRGEGARSPQRIGLSATQRPLETIARFLGGAGPGREVTVVDAGARKPLELQVVVPIEDMTAPGEVLPLDEQPGGPAAGAEARTSIWPAIHPAILELIRSHRSTIVFTNSRRLAERLAQRLNELAGEELVRAHHGSIAREQRVAIEEELKAGRLPALVATSSLELGIDMGAVDLVIQVESPTSVARGLQRVGRAGHQVGAPSKGVIFPKYRGDLLEAAVVAKGMHDGAIEQTTLPRNPLDVLAQQLVAMTVMDPWTVDELLAAVVRATPYETLSREVLEGVLGMLAGAYPSDEFAELKPRVTWDRVSDVVEGRRDARVVAVTSGGTIPDRGLYGVFMIGDPGTPGRRVGELDEEMVYESRAGEVITLGASSWRIEEIGHDRVTVSPAPGVPGKLPFWHGDAVGRPIELGRAIGAFVREAEDDLNRGARGRRAAVDRLQADHDLDPLAAENLIAYLEDEREVVGALPTDRRIVVERFRDELGDWRLVLLTPFGGRVHAPWSLALEARLAERLVADIQTIWSDDGIAIRLPDSDAGFDGVEELLFPDPEELEELVVGQVASSALFASRFRENAARALLLPRRRPGTRTPLWQQRQRAADLLAVASRYGSFPILVETYREVLSDVFDLPALREVLGGVASREISVHRVETLRASPFASSLLFDYVAAYMYDGDAPLAERRAGALTLDRDLLRELLGQEELRELLDPEALADLELSLQALTDDRRATTADQLHDLLRRLGDLSADEIAARSEGGAAAGDAWLTELVTTRRAVPARIAGDDRWIAIEDVARYRDGVGVAPPTGVPDAFLAPATAALEGLARPLRPHPRPVPDPGPGAALGPADRGGRGRARAAPRSGHDPARRVPAGRRRARVDRPGRAARAPPPVAGPTPSRGRAGRAGGARAVPAGLARRRAGRRGRAGPASRRGAGAPRRGRRPAGRPADPGVGPRAGRPAGPDRRLPAAAPRRARGDGRSGLGRAGEPRPGRRPDRSLPARPGGPPADRTRRRHGAPRRPPPRRDPRAPRPAGRVVLPGAVRRGRRRLRPRGARRALGPRLGGRGHERHVRPAPGLALEATGPRRTPQAGPPDLAGAARGGWPVVAGRGRRGERRRSGSTRPPSPCSTGTASSPARRWPPRGSTAGSQAVYPVLRALEEGGRIRRGYFVDGLGAAQFAQAGAIERLRALREPARSPAERDRPPARRRRPGQPVWGGDPVAASRRGRPAAAPARRRRVRRARRRRRGRSTSSAAARRSRRCPPPTTRRLRRPRSGRWRARRRRRVRELVLDKVDGLPVGDSPFRERLLAARLLAGLPRAHPPRAADAERGARPMPEGDTLVPDGRRAAAAPRRPARDGRTGAPAGPPDRAGRRSDDRRPSRRRARTC